MNTIAIVCLLTALISGSVGYFGSRHFWLSKYAQTDKRGDFGGPHGGVYATFSGMLAGMLILSLFGSCLHWIPQEAVGPGLMVCIIVGAITGMVGAVHGTDAKARKQVDRKEPSEHP